VLSKRRKSGSVSIVGVKHTNVIVASSSHKGDLQLNSTGTTGTDGEESGSNRLASCAISVNNMRIREGSDQPETDIGTSRDSGGKVIVHVKGRTGFNISLFGTINSVINNTHSVGIINDSSADGPGRDIGGGNITLGICQGSISRHSCNSSISYCNHTDIISSRNGKTIQLS
jgi:hypothetical protein